jgi:murein DD-endopeptidase MepM/ murein hydrolase activator NlpD
MRHHVLAATLAGPLLVPLPASAQPQHPSLALPIECRLGVDCEIQNYVDRDPGPGARDYQCGSRSYQAHDGIDFRLPDLARQRQGVAVLAAADGRVARVRDGVADVSVRTTGVSAVEGRECGNGVVLRHEAGFETQYCHLAQGSIRVRPGDRVKAGDAIGRVGLSGRTEYPHLHFTVRQARSIVDPFAYGAPEGACEGGTRLWRPELGAALAYKARSVLNAGFAARALDMGAIDDGPEAPTRASAALVAYARAIGLKAGDVQTVTLHGPDGAVLATNTAPPLPRNQAQSMLFAGVRRPAHGWAGGRYTARYVVRQGGRVILDRSFELTL